MFWRDSNIECILAYFGDQQFTIRIDKLRTGEIRYLCWRKSNSILERPSLILRHGKISETSKDRTAYVFHHNDCTFTIERIVPKMEGAPDYFFIEVTDSFQKKSTWKMVQMPIPKYFQNNF